MSVEITRILELLILPPGGPILLGLVAALRWRRLSGRLLMLFSIASLYLLSTPLISGQLIRGLEHYPALSLEQARHADAQAIVVLGGGRYRDAPEYGGDTVNWRLLVRLRYAAYLAEHTGLPIIPAGGSVLSDGAPEAELARRVLEQEFKVKVAAIEDQSRTTFENAQYTKKILDRLGIERVLLVTHAGHMPRSMWAFEHADIDTVAAPTAYQYHSDGEIDLLDWLPQAKGLELSYFALHEYLGMVWYRMQQTL